MESVANKKPCRTCGKNLHIGNPYECQFECKNCLKYMEFQALCEIRLAEIENILGEEYNLEKLKEMVDAERDGRITILPFKIPEKIYKIKNKKIKAYNVLEIAIKGNKIIFRTEVKKCFIGFRYTFVVEKNDVGKIIFLTREEAEKALEGMENENLC